jgi:hypothetical protein
MGTPRLPPDIIHMVVAYLPIRAVIAASLGLCDKTSIRDVLQHRMGHRTLLSQIVPDPDQLLLSMKKYKYIVTSEKISEYFVPGLSDCSNKWEFVVPSHIIPTVILSLDSMGIHVNSSECGPYDHSGQITSHNCVSKHAGPKCLITIKWTNVNLFDYILYRPLSSMRCFVGHFGAVHMYGKLSSTGQMIHSKDLEDECAERLQRYQEDVCLSHSALSDATSYLFRNHRDSVRNSGYTYGIERICAFVRSNTDVLRQMTESDTGFVGGPVYEFSQHIASTFRPENPTPLELLLVTPHLRNVMVSIVTGVTDPCDCPEDEFINDAGRYIELGYSRITLSEYGDQTNGWRGKLPNNAYRVRTLRDSECDGVIFSYKGSQNRSLSKRAVGPYTWYEYHRGVLPTGQEQTLAGIIGLHTTDVCMAVL